MQAIGDAIVGARQALAKEFDRFVARKTQVVGTELQHLVRGACACEKERQCRARGQGAAKVGGRVLDQQLNRMHRPGAVQMVRIVEHQHDLAPARRDALHQADDHALDRLGIAAAPGQQAGLAGDGRIDGLQCREQVVDEPQDVVVVAAQRDPGNLRTDRHQLAPPQLEQRGLAAARGRLNDDEPVRRRGGQGQAREQGLARQQKPGGPRKRSGHRLRIVGFRALGGQGRHRRGFSRTAPAPTRSGWCRPTGLLHNRPRCRPLPLPPRQRPSPRRRGARLSARSDASACWRA
ncbi:hypothetical protein D3C71_1187300 [compost metagenome]